MDPKYQPTWDEAIFAFYNYDYVNNRFDAVHSPNYNSAFRLFSGDIKASAQIFDVLYRTLAFVLPYDKANYDDMDKQVGSGFFEEKYFTSASLAAEKAFEMGGYWLDAFQKYNLADDNNVVIIMLIIEGANAKVIPFTDLKEVIIKPAAYRIIDVTCSREYLPLRQLYYKLKIISMEALTK